MKIAQVEKILKENFESAEDRRYWERKLEDLKRKERTAKENKRYFKKLSVYDR